MPTIRVVTDSTCDLPDALVRQYGIMVIPVTVRLGADLYLDGVDLTTDALLRYLQTDAAHPTTTPPTVTTFEQVYGRLRQDRPCDGVVSIHVGARLSGTYGAALLAREAFAHSAFPVGVVDSQVASLGLGLIVLAAAQCAAAGGTWAEVMRAASRMKGQTHVACFVESIELLHRGGRLPWPAPQIESLLPLKPVLRLDDGQILLMDRTRTRHKALDALCAFVEDFPHVASLGVLHGTAPAELEPLLGRLAAVCPRDSIRVVQYGPANAVYLGAGAIGVAVCEG